MPMSIEKAYATLKDSPQMTQAVGSNNASPFQGVATLAQQYHNQANKKEIPMPMQSVLQQQQAQQPTTFAKGDKVKSKAKSPDHAIDLQIAKQFGPNVPPAIKKILKAGAAHTIATGKPDPGHLRALLKEAAKLPPEIQAQYKPRIDAAKAALAKATGVAGISKFAEGDTVEKVDEVAEVVEDPSELRKGVEALASLYAKPKLSPEMAQMMQMAQEGKQRQGLASTIGAALTGAANPHALQSGQSSAMMAGEAADKGVASLNAGQDMMMAKAAEMEDAPTKNYNTALGQILASQMEDKKYKAALAAAGLKGSNALEVTKLKGKQGLTLEEKKQKGKEGLEGIKQINRKDLEVDKQKGRVALQDTHNKLLKELDLSKDARVRDMTGAQRNAYVQAMTETERKSFADSLNAIGVDFPAKDFADALQNEIAFNTDEYIVNPTGYLAKVRAEIANKGK
jgi:hypothetical protein